VIGVKLTDLKPRPDEEFIKKGEFQV